MVITEFEIEAILSEHFCNAIVPKIYISIEMHPLTTFSKQ